MSNRKDKYVRVVRKPETTSILVKGRKNKYREYEFTFYILDYENLRELSSHPRDPSPPPPVNQHFIPSAGVGESYDISF